MNKWQLFEAYRRFKMFDSVERRKPLLSQWLGLGTFTAYREALDSGLMRFHDDKRPPPRCMGWLCLTEKGAGCLLQLAPEFDAVLSGMKAAGYDKSLSANFSLAGGLKR